MFDLSNWVSVIFLQYKKYVTRPVCKISLSLGPINESGCQGWTQIMQSHWCTTEISLTGFTIRLKAELDLNLWLFRPLIAPGAEKNL
jgi:hypothetical protein